MSRKDVPLSPNSRLVSKRVFSAQPNTLLGTGKRQSQGLRSFQWMQPKYFAVNGIELDTTAAGFILYVTDGVLLLKWP